MKKTTTRLATTTAVILMSAFAIILAQHDARKSGREKDSETDPQPQQLAQSEPPMPLDLSAWPSSSAVIRGNNDLEGFDGADTSENFENPLREASTELLNGSDVITASGEFPAPPSSTSEIPALQPLPQSLTGVQDLNSLPSIQSLPSVSQPLPPSALPPSSGRLSDTGNLTQSAGSATSASPLSNYPQFQSPQSPSGTAGLPAGSSPGLKPSPKNTSNLPGTASLGVPSAANMAPQSAGSWGNSNPPSGNPQSMSDTQRGAMIPTQLVGESPNSNPPSVTQFNDNYPSLPQGSVSSGNGAGFAPLNASNAGNGLANSLPTASSSPGVAIPPATSGRFSDNPNSTMSPGAVGFGSSSSGTNAPAINNLSTGSNSSDFSSGSGRSFSSNSFQGIAANEAMQGAGPRATLASNQPGSRFLDGSQNPVMQIHKRAPEEITVGKKTTFVITVRNAGNATAHEVTVVDRIPRGVRFSEASPNVSPAEDGLLTWKLGEMNAGEEKVIHLQVIPETEGEIGSVASVHFVAQASVRTMATAPKLEIQVDSAGPIVIGQPLSIPITIRNLGTGVARGIRLEVDVPPQLKYASGESELELDIGNIRPNDSLRVTLDVASVQPGQSTCPLRIVNEDGIQSQSQFSVDVRAPQLAATISGPAKRYLDRQATYQIAINNTGTAVARNMNFDLHLPAGLKFVSADIPQATYHPESHSVTLGLAELSPGSNGSFQVTVVPVELGPQNIRFNATGDLGISAEAKGQMVVEGLSELTYTIGQDNGTVEVGATTTYAIQISNVGNQSDKNVQLQVQIPEGAKLLRVDAPVDYRDEPGRLVFAPIGEMRSRDIKTLRFQIQHNRAGNQVIRAQLTSANWPVAVLKEEGTLVYNDQ